LAQLSDRHHEEKRLCLPFVLAGCEMTAYQVAEYLRQYNAWRRGDDSFPQPVPKALGEIIARAIELLESMPSESGGN
jgi:hypothetical protein